MVLNRQPEHERLGDGLNREQRVHVSDRDDGAVGRHDGDAERLRIGLGEFGDIIGDFAVVDGREPAVNLLQHLAQRRRRGLHPAEQQVDFIGG